MNKKGHFTDSGDESPGLLRSRSMTLQNIRGAWFFLGLLAAAAILGWLVVKNSETVPVGGKNPTTVIFTRHDATYAAAIVGNGGIISVGKFGRIFHSPDGSLAWKEISSPTTRDLFGVAFRDDRNGVAVGAGGTYLETADGGHTWVSRDIATTNDLLGVILKPDGRGLMVGSFGLLWRTDTGGRTWESVSVPWDKVLSDVWNNVGPVEPHLYGAAMEGSVVWVVGEYGLVLISTDGGRSFERRRGGNFTDPHLFAVDLAGPMRGVVAGQAGLIASTSDGGITWVESSSWKTDLYDISIYDGTAVISGDLGSVLLLPNITKPAGFQVVAAAGQADRALLGDLWIAAVQRIGQGRFLVLGKGGFRTFTLPPVTHRQG